MHGTVRLTAAQAMMRWLSVQMTEDGERFIEGVWANFGHGNVAGIGAAPLRDTNALPSDGQVIGAVQRVATENTVAMWAAGTMHGALQVIWQAAQGGYHMAYGYSCMGYEVTGAMGIRLADPSKEVICFVGDGSYDIEVQPEVDFVAHAVAVGAHAEKATDIADLEARSVAARGRSVPTVIVIDADRVPGARADGHWWDVAVPETGGPERLEKARQRYDANARLQRVAN